MGKQRLKQSKLVLALVCWFFGWLGAHRFMVGKFGTGILMLVLTFSFLGSPISVMWIIIDFIVIVAGKFTDEDGNQVTNW
ncbi:TM2 domain-containing protein [Bartonella vinsonii]|uniref:TM2 domain-containing protein n=1 Tax=Bartonella vinsonii TaxID=33047 RepID=UPI00314570E9